MRGGLAPDPRLVSLSRENLLWQGHHGCVPGQPGAPPHGREPDPDQNHCLRTRDSYGEPRWGAAHCHCPDRALHGAGIYWPGLRDHRARRHGEHRRYSGGGAASGRGGELNIYLLRSILGSGCLIRNSLISPGRAALRPLREVGVKRSWPVLVALSILGVGVLLTGVMENRYVYFATYVILQYIVLATAWNILGGYTGYVNFGTPAFFAL